MKSSEPTSLSSPNTPLLSAGEDAARLLDEFVSGGRSEETFQRLVECLGPLVHSSALRRTDDPGLAEEVAQNVFTSLARKASALRHHKALLAWVFKATRFEASKALRAARSRERKHKAAAASAETATIMSTNDNEASWREAIPLLDASLDELGTKDRQFILERFYEGKKFSEIASDHHTTEAASKMRVKRALTKLSKLLSARGVSLSVGVITTGLGMELTKAAPVKVMAGIATNALAACPATTASALTINTLQVMNTAKTVTATAVAIIALASIPLISQQSEARKMKSELADLNKRRKAAESGRRSGPAPRSSVRTVHDLLSGSNSGPLNVNDMISDLAIAMTGEDVIGMLEIFLPIADLSSDQYQDLLSQLEDYKGSEDIREMFTQMMTMYAPTDTAGESIERMLRIGAEPHSYADILGRWANEDPSAAIAWFSDKSAAGELEGTAIRDRNEIILLSKLVGGVARKDPGKAIDLLLKFSGGSDDALDGSYSDLAKGLGVWMAGEGNGDDTELERLLAMNDDQYLRAQTLASTMETAIDKNDIKGAVAMIDKHVEDGPRRSDLVIDRIAESELSLAGMFGAVEEHLPEEEVADAVGRIVNMEWYKVKGDIETWVAEQPEGEIRDAVYRSLSGQYAVGEDHYQKAYELAGKIGDPKQRDKALMKFAGRWYSEDEAAARAALPENIISELEKSE